SRRSFVDEPLGGEDALEVRDGARTRVVADDARLLNAADCVREPRSRLRGRNIDRSSALARPGRPPQGGAVRDRRCAARNQLLARHRAPSAGGLHAGRDLPYRQSRDASESNHVLDQRGDLGRRRRHRVRGAVVGAPSIMNTNMGTLSLALMLCAAAATPAFASGHGPVFGAATPTLGRGGWSLDQAWTCRSGDDGQRQQMLKTMVSFGVTENLQLSGSFPLAMGDGRLAPARMMSAMSGDREFEGL